MASGLKFERELEAAIDRALATDACVLPESLGFDLAAQLGLGVPRSVEVVSAREARSLDLSDLAAERLVVKVISPGLAHKSDLGGVVTCGARPDELERAIGAVAASVAGRAAVHGFTVQEFVEHRGAHGGEILLGARWTDDFGPVAVLGLGGLEVERAAGGSLAPILVSAAGRNTGPGLVLGNHELIRFLTASYRGLAPRFQLGALEEAITRLLAFAEIWMAPQRTRRLDVIEFNPVVMGSSGLVALDALVHPAAAGVDVAPPRPLDRLHRLLEPRSIAVAGVSRGRNIGRMILDNILRQGFDRRRLWVVKQGVAEIEGCPCVATFEDLPEPVDLAVLSVAADQLPGLVDTIIAKRRAQSLILISGGVGERAGSESVVAELHASIRTARRDDNHGPVVNGGNCLGIRSVPGRYDTLFIPGHKLVFPVADASPLALLSQSGAFAVARASKLESLNPRYVVTFGNQIDLTLGDYLTHLADDSEVSVFACYLEGFRPLDGRRFLEAVHKIRRSGRTVILYRAGRTKAGARAAASHTASVAGSYRVTRQLTESCGGLVAESIEEFEDLIRTFCALTDREPAGTHLGAATNAGFESVAIGDNLNGLELAELTSGTKEHLEGLFATARINSIVAPGNPLDVTPVLEDPAFAEAAASVLADPNVDLGLIGCVPLTGALQTLPAGEDHGENLSAPTAVAQRLIGLWRSSPKPWVAVVDGGSLYDPFARVLESAGIPTFRSVDRALRALSAWARFAVSD